MARRVSCTTITLAFIVLALAGGVHAATPRSLVATIQRVSDGDTVIA